MKTPLLYICYGVPKSGSSLAHALSAVIAERGGFDQSPLAVPGIGHGHLRANFVPSLKSEHLRPALDAARSDQRRMVVLKTHGRVTPALRAAVDRGAVRVQAHIRDPRDVALSMWDAARRGDAWGTLAEDAPITAPEEARTRIVRQIGFFRDWATLPGALVLDYERTAFETAATARRIARHMGVAPAPLRDAFGAKRRFTQFNAGRSQRHLTEMTPEQAADWYAEFHEIIDLHRLAEPPRRTWPGRLMTRLARLSAGRL